MTQPGTATDASRPVLPSVPPADPQFVDPAIGRVVVSQADLQQRVRDLGAQITADYTGRPPLLVGVLKGACFFLSDLARAIDLPVEIDFMAVSSYGSATHTSGVVRILKDLDLDLTGRHVLIVEDIVDSGLTLSYLRRNLAARQPASLQVVALLVKEGLQSVDLDLAYEGFRIPPEFVIGYGLDAAERYRNLPFVAIYKDPAHPEAGASLGDLMKRVVRSPIPYAVVAVAVGLLLFNVLRSGPTRTTLSLSDFQADLNVPGKVVSAVIHDSSDELTGKLQDGTSFVVAYPDRLTETLTTKLLASGATVKVSHARSNPWLSALFDWGPIILLFAFVLFLVNLLQGGGSKVMQFGKAKVKTAGKDQPKVTFADVAGAGEAVAELQEIKEFLESPGRFQALGARIPKGVLLFGPPGTGKTLLARAVAGEAGVPFFSISGSDFVEMFVGVGASRVRDLFDQAKANAPAIVFMDEIDAVGRHRGAGLGGGHDEREQTLNQLLVEMDGFDVRGGVILIAATNRPDILDPALLRPGRFDRQIVVDRPDLAGRRQILAVHAEGKPMATSADLDVLAKRTPGFTGADLANLLNEAAILTARRNLRQIGMRECEEAIDRVLAGPERKTLVMSEHDKLVTAYHEAGHALVGHVLHDADPIHKVSIVARSRSLGLTYTLPEDRYNHSRSQLRDTMAMCLGGRTAEEIVFSEPTTGAENDIEKVTHIARAMVTEYGMSDSLGPQQLGQAGGEVFLGREFGRQANYSEDVAATIDREVRHLIDQAHDRARAVLTHHRPTLELMAQQLVEKETLDPLELADILGPLEPWPASVPDALATPTVRPRRQRRGRSPGNEPIDPVPADVVDSAPAGEVSGGGGGRRSPAGAPGRRAPATAARRHGTDASAPGPGEGPPAAVPPSPGTGGPRRGSDPGPEVPVATRNKNKQSGGGARSSARASSPPTDEPLPPRRSRPRAEPLEP